jgi:hypothetical protein
MKKLFFVFAMTAVSLSVFAQKDKSAKKDPWSSDELWNPIPINRQLSHDKIDRLQKQIDEFDGKLNKDINLIGDDIGSEIITDAIIRRVDRLQIILENLPIDHWTKIKYYLLLEEDVKQCYNDITANTVDANYYKDLIYNFEIIFKKQQEGESILPYINENFTRSLFGSMHMYKDDKAAIAAAYNGMVKMYPEEMMKRYNEYAYMDAATTMMAYLVKKNPSLILTYATSTAQERNAVRKSTDPLVMKIVEIADKAKTPLKAIVYLDQLNNGSMTIAQVNAVTEDNASYYKSLVQLRLKDNPMSKKVIERESKLQALEYVRTMNELHEAQDPVRFKCIEPLSAKEIYFLLVMCSDEIYTSTFVGSFNRMLPKMASTKGDVFLQEMNMDKFRTFIRMSAGYNKLDEFLATMDEPSKNNLMATFVHNIDKNPETDVADAVDVADAFGSIKDENLLYYLLEELKKDYERTYQENNKRGLITYFLLNTLCTSILNPEETNDDLQAQLKVPPISFVTDKSLLDAKGRVIMQTYFYGDDDGKQSYGSFMTNFKADEWKIEKNAQWTTITSMKGSPVTVYANMPLQEPQDEEAQNALNDYLKKNNIFPSILVHRGHSYHLATTLKNITPQNKIIVLGSCGGYHNLSSILTKSEDAHIISSKQTGTMLVNDPIVRALNTRLTQSKDINWIDLWDEVGKQMNTPALQDKFNDYVPPHKNMGALFLKAFKIQMKENGLL